MVELGERRKNNYCIGYLEQPIIFLACPYVARPYEVDVI